METVRRRETYTCLYEVRLRDSTFLTGASSPFTGTIFSSITYGPTCRSIWGK